MGCNTSKTFIAKETYHPYDNEWEGFTTQSYEESRVRKIQLEIKFPARIRNPIFQLLVYSYSAIKDRMRPEVKND